MSDFPYVAPPADGLRQAMAAARGRRVRTASLSSTAAATALFVAVAVLGGQSTQSLIQQPAPEQPAVTRLVPGPTTAIDEATRNTVSAVTSNSAAPPTGNGGLLGVPPLVSGDHNPVEGPDAQEPSQVTGKPYAAGKISRSDGQVYLPTDPRCNVTGKTEDATTLCPSTTAYASGTGSYNLYADVCSTRTDTSLLHFEGRNEVDFTIRRGTKQVWRWSRWHPEVEQPHTIAVDTGVCSQWSLLWTGVDASGQKLPKGDYTLQTTFLANELQGRSVLTYTFTIT